jgi:hypothetical protein
MTPSTRIVLRAELVARAVPLQPVLREHAGTGEADGRGSGPSPDRRRLLPHLHTDQIRRLRGGHPNRGYADRARSRAMGGYAASRRLRRSTPCSTCTARVVSPRKTGCSSTGVMPTPRHGIPDSTPSWVARSLASHYWQSRSESARWCNCRLARALVGLHRAHARSP